MSYQKIDVRPIAGSLGAEVHGVDLSQQLDNQTTDEIHRAFLENLVIFFRDQDISPEQQVAFTRKFGPYGPVPFVKPLDGHPEIIAVVKEADETTTANFGGTWHSDFSFQVEPPLGSVLYALETPAYGGDTMFANMYQAYDALSDGMKEMLDGLIAVHSATNAYGTRARYDLNALRSMEIETGVEGDAEMEHPVVRTHPETGRKCLFVNPVYTIRFKGMTARESAPLLTYLCEHSVRPEFTCRFRWRDKSLALWDNRCTQHLALNDYPGFRREMHRTTIAGDRPH